MLDKTKGFSSSLFITLLTIVPQISSPIPPPWPIPPPILPLGDPLKAFIPGNLTIGALIAVNLPGKDGQCSVVNPFLGMEVLEALLYSIDQINANESLLPNITLGVKAYDTCASETAALDRAVKEFVLGRTWHSSKEPCNHHTRPVIGVIGPGYSFEAVHVASFLEIFEIPLISFAATSPELSDKSKFKYFSRTIPSDTFQMQAILDLLIYYNWTYVSLLYTDESYGFNGMEILIKEGHRNGICFATKQAVPLPYAKREYKRIVSNILSSDPMASVVILVCVEPGLGPLIEEFEKQLSGSKRTFQLVGTETLGIVANRMLHEIPELAKHIFFIFQSAASIPVFTEYFSSLSPRKNTRNPWFEDYFADVANCSFGKQVNTSSKVPCDPNQTLADLNYSAYFHGGSVYMPMVIDGVYAFAHALHLILADRCSADEACGALEKISGRKLLDALREQTFKSPSGSTVNFTKSGDVIGKLDVFYLGQASDGSYKNTKVGEWEKRLDLAQPRGTTFTPMRSLCWETCGANRIRRGLVGKPSCCWKCELCASNAFAVNETTCQSCREGYVPDHSYRKCIRIKAKYFTLDGDVIPIYVIVIPMVMSIVGIVGVCLVAFVLLKYQSTPLVKASGRELSCLLLCGLLLSFLFPFIAILKPSRSKCFFEFVFDSFPFTVSYVAIAVKNNRIFRIFNPDRSLTVTPSLVRPKFQIMVSFVFISFQVVLLFFLMFFDVPQAKFVHSSLTETYLVCVTSNMQVVVSQMYNIVLLIVCAYYAYKTRNTPKNFNEARYIAFAMYGSVVSAFVFIVVFFVTFSTHPYGKLTVNCYRVTLMAMVLLVCFFAPKIYIVVCKSEENVNNAFATRDSAATPSGEQERCDNDTLRFRSKPFNKIGTSEVNKIENTNSRSTQTDSQT